MRDTSVGSLSLPPGEGTDWGMLLNYADLKMTL
jgi:hypothetical protein